MNCHHCGAANPVDSWRCQHCLTILYRRGSKLDSKVSTAPPDLKQAQRPTLTRFDITNAEDAVFEEVRSTPPQPQEAQGHSTLPPDPPATLDPAHSVAPNSEFRIKAAENHRSTWLFTGVGLLILAAIAFVAFGPSISEDPNKIFARAEQLYASGNYSEAITAYQRFIRRFPGNNLAEIAQDRITEIDNKLLYSRREQQQKITVLVKNAQKAFQRKRYLLPAKDNVVLYTSDILRIYPSHPIALNLQSQVVGFYRDQAESHYNSRNYKSAIICYEKILRITPTDETTQKKLFALQRIVQNR